MAHVHETSSTVHTHETPTFANARVEWALRSDVGRGVVLMRRYVPTLNRTPIWQDVATFPNVNDAEQVFRILEQAATR